jgi:hypothetical protein
MQVFLSWSKPTSQALALALRAWLPEVIQQIEPWVSSEDIDKGQRWSPEIAERLEQTGQGLVCVTAENMREPWLNFEAGALAKSMASARVRPLLFDVEPTDVTGPLSQFQAAQLTDPNDMLKVLGSLNAACGQPLSEERLKRAFSRTWSDFEVELNKARQLTTTDAPPARTVEDKIDELLRIVRRLDQDPGIIDGGDVFTIDVPRRKSQRAPMVRGEKSLARLERDLRPGVPIYHDNFGAGEVLALKGTGRSLQAQIAFQGQDEPKWLLLLYTPLRILGAASEGPDLGGEAVRYSPGEWPEEPPS